MTRLRLAGSERHAFASHRSCAERRGGWCASLAGLMLAALLSSLPGPARAEQPSETRYDLHLFLSNGSPAVGASIRVMAPEGERPALIADDRGCARVEDLEPGDAAFFLATSADGKESTFRPVLVVPEGHPIMTLRLYPPGFAAGQLLDERGAPAKGVGVHLSGWEWLEASGLVGSATTDAEGRFRIAGLIAGAYYSVTATQGSPETPSPSWSCPPFTMLGWDGWYNVGILLPAGTETSAPRPEGEAVGRIVSGGEEWYDAADSQWRPAVETYDPNWNWAPAPDGAEWVWRAGRPDAPAEREGATIEFRRRFTVPEGKKVVGYLTIGADDYVAVRLNGRWVGHTNQFYQLVGLVAPTEAFRAGENELRLTLTNIAMTARDLYNPTGVTYTLELIEAKE